MSDYSSSSKRTGLNALLGGSMASGSPVLLLVVAVTLATVLGGSSDTPSPAPPGSVPGIKDGEPSKVEADASGKTRGLPDEIQIHDKFAAVEPLWNYLGLELADLNGADSI